MSLPHVQGPDFLGIGAQKAGTTTVSFCLRTHPGMWLPPVKELHYFHDDWHRDGSSPRPHVKRRKVRRALGPLTLGDGLTGPGNRWCDAKWLGRYYLGTPSEAWYRSLFPAEGDRVRGEITPRYSILGDDEVARIRARFPDLRIFFIMRDPVQRAWSQVRFAERAMTERDILEMLEGPRQHLRSSYDRTLAIWERHFPEASFLPMFFEELRSDPRPFMSELCDFLGADPGRLDPRVIGQRRNVSPSMPMPPRVQEHLEHVYGPMKRRLAERFPSVERLWGLS